MIDKYENIRKAIKVTTRDISRHRVMDCTNIAILNEAIIDLHDAKAQAELNARVLQKIADGDDWFDIETAPRDRVKVLGLTAHGEEVVRFNHEEEKIDGDDVYRYQSGWAGLETDSTCFQAVYYSYRKPRKSQHQPTHWKHIDGKKHIEMMMEREIKDD